MKRLFIAASLITTTLLSSKAQDAPTITAPLTTPILSKRGYPILPEAGDWSLSIDASTPLKFVGQLFSGGNNNTSAFGYGLPLTQSILVRKFIDANTAYRGIVGFNLGSNTTKNLVNQNNSTAVPIPLVTDKRTNTTTAINLGVGLEKRRGIGRVQGIYGAEAIIGFAGSGSSYDYGNSFSANNATPTSTTNFDTPTVGNVNNRVKTNRIGKTISLSVLAFGGVEYFIAPKISLGGEFTWGPKISLTGQGKTETEFANQTTTTKTAGASSLAIGLDNAGGNLRLNFYF